MEPDILAQAADSASAPPQQEAVPWKQILWLCLVSVFVLLTGWPASILVVAVGALVFADAWMAGIRKKPNDSSFLNISPLAWGITVDLLFVVSFPLYLLNRDSLKTRRGNVVIWTLIIVLGCFLMLVIFLWLLSVLGFLGR